MTKKSSYKTHEIDGIILDTSTFRIKTGVKLRIPYTAAEADYISKKEKMPRKQTYKYSALIGAAKELIRVYEMIISLLFYKQ